MSELKYKQTWELREEILAAVGVDPGDRYRERADAGIRKSNLLIVAAELQPDDETRDYADVTMGTLYSILGEWVGVEHEGTAGIDWTMNRDLLKAIHTELHD